MTAADRSAVAHYEKRFGSFPERRHAVLLGLYGLATVLLIAVNFFLISDVLTVALVTVAGAAFGVVGLLLHAHTRLKAADPGVLGIAPLASGAVSLVFYQPMPVRVAAGILGAGIGTWLLYRLFLIPRRQSHRLTAVAGGLMVGMSVTAIVGVLVVGSGGTIAQVVAAQVGRVQDLSVVSGWVIALVVGFIVAIIWMASAKLNYFYAGARAAELFGVNAQRSAVLSFVAMVLLVGCVSAVLGPLLGVGLTAVAAARAFLPFDLRLLIPATAAAGAGLVLLALLLRQFTGIPIGVGAASVGCCLMLVWLVKGNL